MSEGEKRDVVVLGAGIVGLAVAHFALREGRKVTVVDRDPEGDKASLGNAGGIAVTEVVPASVPGLLWKVPGWLVDPLGPLAVRPAHAPRLVPWLYRFAKAGRAAEVGRLSSALSALNGRVYDDLIPMLSDAGLAGELHRKGALTVYESVKALHAHQTEWDIRRSHGIVTKTLTGQQAREMEPALAPSIDAAVFTPQWSHVSDPKRIVEGLRIHVVRGGARLETRDVRAVAPDARSGVRITFANGERMESDHIVVAAGAWSGAVSRSLGDRVLLESERGYNTTIADPSVHLEREIIFAEKKFVATPLSCGLRIGGAAEFGGLDALANYKRSNALAELAKRYLPGLRTETGVRWAGHRPTTPDSLPVIGASPRVPGVIYAFGHGHLGLTHAATTGRLVADLLAGRTPGVDLAPYSIARFS